MLVITGKTESGEGPSRIAIDSVVRDSGGASATAQSREDARSNEGEEEGAVQSKVFLLFFSRLPAPIMLS